MSGSPVCRNSPLADAVVTQAVLPLSPSFTGWSIPRDNDSPSIGITSGQEGLQHSSISSTCSDLVDLTVTDEEAEPDPVVWNVHSSSDPQARAVDLTEDLQPVLSDSQSSSLSLNEMAEATLGVPAPLDLIQQLHSCDNVSIPKRYRKKSSESFQFAAIDLTHDSPDEKSEYVTGSYTSPLPSDSAKSREAAISSINLPASASKDTRYNADIDAPMPRILPKFEEKSSGNLIDLEGHTEDEKEDIITKEELDTWLQSQIRRGPGIGRYGSSPNRMYRPTPRNTPVEQPFRILETYTHSGIVLRPSVNVELRDSTFVREVDRNGTENEHHNYFMRIVDIIQDTRNQAVTLRGWVFQRAQYLNGVLEKKRNELCWVMHVDEDDTRDIKVQSMETTSVNDIVRRRKIRLTNQPWPKLSFREDAHMLEDSEDTIRNERVLVCRFMYICYYVCSERRETNCWSERVLQRLRHADCDKWSGPEGEPCALEDAELRKAWRGETVPGGAFSLNQQRETWHERLVDTARKYTIDLTEDIVKRDPHDFVCTSVTRDSVRPFTITGIATRVDWTTDDGTEYYTISGFTPPKRRAETDLSSGRTKCHRTDQFPLKVERPPASKCMLSQLRQRSSVFEVAPGDGWSQPSPASKSEAKPSITDYKPFPSKKRQYTFGDSFCGAGGMSRAAHQTGLHIKYAFDCNKNACTSYAMNFPRADLHCLWADEFVRVHGDRKVDIAHLSPPCQFFSDAHTVAGKDDEMNTASLFAVGELLKKSKPRIVTLEQTFGIVLRARHQGYLNALVQVFTSHGFSIRWRLLHCADYGLPQMRLRTFMIASCPGEPLPPFPKPTHSSSSSTTGLLAWTTINATINSIPPSAPNHEPEKCKIRDEVPRSGDRIARTITCNGGGQVHPSGKRDLTIREFAALQGFPMEHVFGQVGAKKQIGNAVPPLVGRRVLESVVEALEREDGIGGQS
ncbi:MAG: hypothetical protein Q9225_004918 [Loekoesia sp. 1 TL-2023]